MESKARRRRLNLKPKISAKTLELNGKSLNQTETSGKWMNHLNFLYSNIFNLNLKFKTSIQCYLIYSKTWNLSKSSLIIFTFCECA
jgi:hypothetical protein